MKVILISPFTEFSKGGISTHIRNFKKYYPLNGVDCDVYVLSNNLFKSMFEIFRLSLSNYDIIHVHSSFFSVFCLSIAKVFTSSKYFFTFHTQPENNYTRPCFTNYIKYLLLEFILNNYFFITTVSESIIKNYNSKVGLKLYNYKVIHSGVDFVELLHYPTRSQSKNIKIISIGLFEWDWKVQGHLLALKAFKRLKIEFNNISFSIIGSGSKEQIILNEINSLNLSKSVQIHNNVSEVQKLLIHGDIYLHTGLNEGCSLAILEARSLNLCTIVVDIGGNNELIENNVNGILCEPSSDGIFISLRKMILDEVSLIRLKKDSIIGISNFKWINIIQEYLNIYKKNLDE